MLGKSRPAQFRQTGLFESGSDEQSAVYHSDATLWGEGIHWVSIYPVSTYWLMDANCLQNERSTAYDDHSHPLRSRLTLLEFSRRTFAGWSLGRREGGTLLDVGVSALGTGNGERLRGEVVKVVSCTSAPEGSVGIRYIYRHTCP